MRSFYRSASLASLVAGALWAFSQSASAQFISITNQVFTGNAPLATTPNPASASGNFVRQAVGSIAGGEVSPYIDNTGPGPDGSLAAANGMYSVLGGGAFGSSPTGSAIYNVNSFSFTLLWGSPDDHNQVEFFAANGAAEGLFLGPDLACVAATCPFDVVTFTATDALIALGFNIATVELSNFNTPAFEYGIIPNVPTSTTPLPPAIYLFGSVLGGAFWLGRRKRGAVSSLGSA